MTLVSKEFMATIQVNKRELTRNSESGIYIKLQEHQIFACLRYFADKLCQQSKPSSSLNIGHYPYCLKTYLYS